VLALEPSEDGSAAFLTAGVDAALTAWRIPPGVGRAEATVHSIQQMRTDRILAVGDADRACLLGNAEQTVHSVWLTGHLGTAGSLQLVAEGGRTAEIALAVGPEATVAAVADGYGVVEVFDLAPGARPAPVGRHDIGDPVYHLAFADRRAEVLVAGTWSGMVAALRAHDQAGSGPLRMTHGETAVTVIPLGETDGSVLVATRSLMGITRVWQLPSATVPIAEEPPLTALALVSLEDRRSVMVAASAG
jgi:hypothetical protein